jgi:hypothetical protein
MSNETTTPTVPFLTVIVRQMNLRTQAVREDVWSGRFRDIEEARRYYFNAVSVVIDENFETGEETIWKIVGVTPSMIQLL